MKKVDFLHVKLLINRSFIGFNETIKHQDFINFDLVKRVKIAFEINRLFIEWITTWLFYLCAKFFTSIHQENLLIYSEGAGFHYQ